MGEFTVTVAIKDPLTASVASSLHPDVLSSITEAEITLAIWRRELPDALKVIANRVKKHSVELICTFDPFCNNARQQFKREMAGLGESRIELLADDILNLSQSIANTSQKTLVRVRLETVADNGCCKFHLDNVFMRLVVTYAGPGTQWVSPAFAAAARDNQEAYIGPLNSIGTGDVAIFLGKKSGDGDLIYHRSPPLTVGDTPRLVAVIDAVDA